MRLIDADKLIKRCMNGIDNDFIDIVNEMPTVKVLNKIRDEIDEELLSYAKTVEGIGDSARKIRISLGIVRKIIDNHRKESE